MVTSPNSMTLFPEVAAVLRKALNDANFFRCGEDYPAAFAELAEAIENLLEPLPEGSAPAPSQAVPYRVLSADERAKLKELAEAATPGPWQSVVDVPNPDPYSHDEPAVITLNPTPHGYGNFVVGLVWYDGPHTGCTVENGAYIAAMSPDVALGTLAYVAHLEQALVTLAAERVTKPTGNAAGYELIRQQMARRCAKCGGKVNGHEECPVCEPDKVASHE